MKLGEVLQCSGEGPYQGTGPSLLKVLSPFSLKNLLDYTLFKQNKMDVTLHWYADTKIITYGWASRI